MASAPPRFWIFMLKPLEVPSAGIGGGFRAKMLALLTPESAAMARALRASTLWAAPGRSSHGCRAMKPMAAF